MENTNVGARGRWPWLALGALVILVFGAAVGWAGSVVLTPADEALDTRSHTFVSVEAGEVGSTVSLNTTAEWTPVPVGANRASGVVTSVAVSPGDEVSQGSVLYTVDLRPVVVAQGAIPAFRPVGLDAEGEDVAQVQAMLAARGFYAGRADGTAGPATVRAIKAWQASVGIAESGVIDVGDVIFVPTLPTRVTLDGEAIFRGATVSGGENVIRALPVAPVFEVPVTESQAALIPSGTRVEISSPGGDEWIGIAREQSTDPDSGTVRVALEGEGGGVICGDQCGQVPVTGGALLQSRVVTVETVTGLVVPSAALITGADGEVAVVDADGERVPVTVVASARGMSVIEGVNKSVRVRVPAEAP